MECMRSNSERKSKKQKRISEGDMIKKDFKKCIKSGNLPEAFEAFEAFRKLSDDKKAPSDIFFYNGLLKLCIVSEESLTRNYAYRIFNQMELVGFNNCSPLATETTFSSMINVCSHLKDIERGFSYIELMEALQILPRLRTYASLLEVVAGLNNTYAACRLYDLTVAHRIQLTEKEFLALLQLYLGTRDSANFTAVLSKYMFEITDPSRLSWEIVQDWFSPKSDNTETRQAIWKCNIGKVSVDGICSISGARLQPLLLSEDYKQKLLKQIDSLVCTNSKRSDQWGVFKSWLECNAKDGYDVIVDAANVGFCTSSGTKSSFNFSQVKSVVSHYESNGKRVLVVLHELRAKYLIKEATLLEQWRLRGTLYCCLAGNNDDWYWLYAAVWSKRNSLIVTNDLMRDHNYIMLGDNFFEHWKASRQVFFSIKCIQGVKTVVFQEPSKFARRIQKLKNSWHFPAKDSENWLCIENGDTGI